MLRADSGRCPGAHVRDCRPVENANRTPGLVVVQHECGDDVWQAMYVRVRLEPRRPLDATDGGIRHIARHQVKPTVDAAGTDIDRYFRRYDNGAPAVRLVGKFHGVDHFVHLDARMHLRTS